MTAVVSAVLFFLYWKTGKKDLSKHVKGGFKDKAARAFHAFRVLILFCAVCTLLSANFFGFTLRSVVSSVGTTVLGWIGMPFGVSGSIVATLFLIAAVATAVIDVAHDLNVDRPAKNALVMIPFLAVMATGTIAATAQSVTATMTSPEAVVNLFH